MSSIYTPAIQAIEKWGDLDETPQGVANKREFLKYLSSFTHFVDGKNCVYQQSCEIFPLINRLH